MSKLIKYKSLWFNIFQLLTFNDNLIKQKKKTSYHVVVGLLAHESSEGDDGRDAGKVQEDDGGQALDVQTILEVTDAVLALPHDVSPEAPK